MSDMYGVEVQWYICRDSCSTMFNREMFLNIGFIDRSSANKNIAMASIAMVKQHRRSNTKMAYDDVLQWALPKWHSKHPHLMS